jgi:hypothetical protein
MTFFKGINTAISLGIIKAVTPSEPVVVDVIAKKKTLTKGTGVTYSNIKTSPDGLLNQTEVQKKTLLGG